MGLHEAQISLRRNKFSYSQDDLDYELYLARLKHTNPIFD